MQPMRSVPLSRNRMATNVRSRPTDTPLWDGAESGPHVGESGRARCCGPGTTTGDPRESGLNPRTRRRRLLASTSSASGNTSSCTCPKASSSSTARGRWCGATARRSECSGARWTTGVGQSGLALVHPDDQEFVLRSLTTIQDKDVGTPIEIRINAASGWRLVEIVGTTVQWFGEDVVLLCLRDLTERRRFELAGGREARFRSLVHNAGSVIMLVSPEGMLQSVSGAMTRLLGHDPELLEHRPLADIVAESDRAAFDAALDAARAGTASGHPVTARVGDAAPRRWPRRPFRAEHRQPVGRPDGRGLRHLRARRQAQVAAELELSEALSLLTATLGRHGGRHPGGRLGGEDHQLQPPLRRDLAAPRRHPGQRGRHRRRSTSSWATWPHPEAFVAKVEELFAKPEMESFDTLEFRDGRVVERQSGPSGWTADRGAGLELP